MIPLYTQQEYDSAKSQDLLKLECEFCHNSFLGRKNDIRRSTISKYHSCKFCSQICSSKARTTKKLVNCKQCGKEFNKNNFEFRRSPNHFCSSSCNATYQNSHKTTGIRISKLELWLQSQLPILYQNLEFKFNSKTEINSELDIYIPSLKLAFELNGLFHYEPIYGSDKLNQIQNNDNRKFQACLERGIELCIIDSSKQKYFNIKSSKIYLEIIQKIINNKTRVV